MTLRKTCSRSASGVGRFRGTGICTRCSSSGATGTDASTSYEEVPNWSFTTLLTHLHGVIPDLRYGPDFEIGRYAAVGDSRWAKLLFDWWHVIRPIWPVAPETMRYFQMRDRERALRWIREGR